MADEFALLKNVFGVEEKPAESVPIRTIDPMDEAKAIAELAKPKSAASGLTKWIEPEKIAAMGPSPLASSSQYLSYAERLQRDMAAALSIPSHVMDERLKPGRPLSELKLALVQDQQGWRLVAIDNGYEIVLATGETTTIEVRLVTPKKRPGFGEPYVYWNEQVFSLYRPTFNAAGLVNLGMRVDAVQRAG